MRTTLSFIYQPVGRISAPRHNYKIFVGFIDIIKTCAKVFSKFWGLFFNHCCLLLVYIHFCSFKEQLEEFFLLCGDISSKD